MSGPIVRTGTTPAFWENWDRAFGGEKGATGASRKKTSKAARKKTAKKKPGKGKK